MVQIAHTVPTLSLTDCVPDVDSVEPNLMRIFHYQRRGDPNMMVSSSGRPFYVHITVTVSLHRIHGAGVSVIFMLFFLYRLTTVLISGGMNGHSGTV